MTQNIKQMLLLAGLLGVGDYCFFELVNCSNVIICSFLFSLSLSAVYILSCLIGGVDTLKTSLVHSIIAMYYCTNLSLTIQGYHFEEISIVSIITFLFATSVSLYDARLMKTKDNFNGCIRFISIAAVVDGIIMSTYYLNKMSVVPVVLIFIKELVLKLLFAYLVSRSAKYITTGFEKKFNRGK